MLYSDLNLIRAREDGYNHVLMSPHLGTRHVENPSPEYLSHDLWQVRFTRLIGIQFKLLIIFNEGKMSESKIPE